MLEKKYILSFSLTILGQRTRKQVGPINLALLKALLLSLGHIFPHKGPTLVLESEAFASSGPMSQRIIRANQFDPVDYKGTFGFQWPHLFLIESKFVTGVLVKSAFQRSRTINYIVNFKACKTLLTKQKQMMQCNAMYKNEKYQIFFRTTLEGINY